MSSAVAEEWLRKPHAYEGTTRPTPSDTKKIREKIKSGPETATPQEKRRASKTKREENKDRESQVGNQLEAGVKWSLRSDITENWPEAG